MIAQLEIKDLSLSFRTRHGVVRALEDVSLSVERGEIVGVVGESGSGKSVMAYAVMGLNDAAAKIQKGSITVGGIDMLSTSPDVLRGVRGREIAMIFQSPRTAPNPARRASDRGRAARTRDHHAPRSQDGGDRSACKGPDSRSRATLLGLPVRTVRRHVPTRDDRHCSRLHTIGPDRR
jgi:ABC-type dipeptide/oligopeptide/nickel transport system ATPase component